MSTPTGCSYRTPTGSGYATFYFRSRTVSLRLPGSLPPLRGGITPLWGVITRRLMRAHACAYTCARVRTRVRVCVAILAIFTANLVKRSGWILPILWFWPKLCDFSFLWPDPVGDRYHTPMGCDKEKPLFWNLSQNCSLKEVKPYLFELVSQNLNRLQKILYTKATLKLHKP